MAKRYALFAGSNYYPGGGWNDFVGLYDSPDEAMAGVINWRNEWRQRPEWGHVADLLTGTIVKWGWEHSKNMDESPFDWFDHDPANPPIE